MGVSRTVDVCIEHDGPLPLESRLQVVEVCIRHTLLSGECWWRLPTIVPPSGIRDRIRRLLGDPPRIVFANEETAIAGAWIERRIREIDDRSAWEIYCPAPRWKDAPVREGEFRYRATREPFVVKAVNALLPPGKQSPFAPADGVVGSFWDVLRLDTRDQPDGRALAHSSFVAELETVTGCKVLCRTSVG